MHTVEPIGFLTGELGLNQLDEAHPGVASWSARHPSLVCVRDLPATYPIKTTWQEQLVLFITHFESFPVRPSPLSDHGELPS